MGLILQELKPWVQFLEFNPTGDLWDIGKNINLRVIPTMGQGNWGIYIYLQNSY